MNTFAVSRGLSGRIDPFRCWWDKWVLWKVAPVRGVNLYIEEASFDTREVAERAMKIRIEEQKNAQRQQAPTPSHGRSRKRSFISRHF